jgi:hypothetical protein
MTVQIEIDEEALAEVDESLKLLNQDRDDFFRQGILELVAKANREAVVARQYAEAYEKTPVLQDEFFVEEAQLIEAWKDV